MIIGHHLPALITQIAAWALKEINFLPKKVKMGASEPTSVEQGGEMVPQKKVTTPCGGVLGQII